MKPIFIIPIFMALSASNSNLYIEGDFAHDATPTTYEYTKAIDLGLRTIAPFPNPDDVCMCAMADARAPLLRSCVSPVACVLRWLFLIGDADRRCSESRRDVDLDEYSTLFTCCL